MGTGSKNQQMGSHGIKNFLHSKGNYQQNEQLPYGMGENL